jgi:hypothetical protein
MKWLQNVVMFRYSVDRERARDIIKLAEERRAPGAGWRGISEETMNSILDETALEYLMKLSDEEAEELNRENSLIVRQ